MKIGVRLTITYVVLIVILGIIIALSLTNLSKMNKSMDLVAHDRFPKTVWANNIVEAVNDAARSMRMLIILNTEDFAEETKNNLKRIENSTVNIQKNIDSLTATIKTEEGIKLIEELNTARNGYIESRNDFLEIIKEEDYFSASIYLAEGLREPQANYFKAISNLISYQNELVVKAADDAEADYKQAFWTMVITAVIAIILAIVMALYIIRGITNPLNRAVNAANSIANGDMSVDLNTDAKDETGILLNSMKTMSQNIGKLVAELNKVADMAVQGKLDNRGDEHSFKGDYQLIVKGFNATLDAVIGPLNVTAEYVDRISKGDIPPRITDEYKGDFNEIKNNLNQAIDVMNGLLAETNMLIKATKDGKLDTRGNAGKFVGGWGELVGGVNELVDAFVAPINVTAEYVDRISKGDIPPKIVDEYKGDFNEIKNNLNQAIDVMNGLLAETNMLIKATKEGKLDTRGNAGKFVGGWGELVGGVNELVDAFVAPINVTAEYVDRISKGDIPPRIVDEYKGDFNEIKNNLNQAIDVMNGLLTETNMLIKATKEGKLDTRGNAGKFVGGWGELIAGVNELIDAFVGPINVTAEYVDRISKGDIPPRIVDEYKGDFNEIKNNLNQAIDVMNGLLIETNMLIKATKDGKLDTRGNAGKFVGGWSELISGVNDLINAFVGPINVTAEYVDRISKGDIPPKITDEYKGDFNEIKNNLNQAIDAINLLVSDAKKLALAAKEGQLETRANADRHFGDYRVIVDGVNVTLDNVIEPINEAADVLSQMSTGDLTVRMRKDYKGDLSKLKNDINALGDSLSTLINQVNDTVQTTASSAIEISSTAESLAAASQEQSAQADEVASAVEQMSRTVTENAMSANKTSEMAQENSHVATEGGRVVQQTVQKMRDIAVVVENSAANIAKLGESSKQIGEIISVIDDIADQTNLLALNAAIEAARAGEQGRGFAVVADEVRKLAERTTEATKQIAEMIKGIQSETEQAVVAMNKGNEEVQSGIELADRAGQSLESILGSTHELLDMINQIAAASEEQSATSEQISKNVVSISKVTADSTRRIEDVAHTSEDLARLTEHLSELMSQFQVDSSNEISSSKMQKLGKGGNRRLHS